MIEVTVGTDKKIKVEKQKDLIVLNGQESNYSIEKIATSTYKVFNDQKIFTIDVLSQEGKNMTLKVGNKTVDVNVTDHIDQILAQLGMDSVQASVVKEIKAPMPGAILNVIVTEGSAVQAGDQLLVLEAMKMENVIKSPGDGVVSKIHVKAKDSVEKNQVLISFE